MAEPVGYVLAATEQGVVGKTVYPDEAAAVDMAEFVNYYNDMHGTDEPEYRPYALVEIVPDLD